MEAGTLQIVDNNYDNENNKKRYLFHLPCCVRVGARIKEVRGVGDAINVPGIY